MILPSKQGQIYVLNRRTGKSLFPVEERPVPKDGVEADALSPTQPYSGYAHLDQPKLTERDMWGMSPLDQLYCRIQFRRAAYQGEYTAPTVDKPYIEYPGYNGGSDWGSVAVDPERGILVANYNDTANFNRLMPRAKADAEGMKPIYEGGEPRRRRGRRADRLALRHLRQRRLARAVPGSSASSRPTAASAASISPPARPSGTTRSAAPRRTARSASRRCCR